MIEFLLFWMRAALLTGAAFTGALAAFQAQAGHPPAAVGFGLGCVLCLALWLHAIKPAKTTGRR